MLMISDFWSEACISKLRSSAEGTKEGLWVVWGERSQYLSGQDGNCSIYQEGQNQKPDEYDGGSQEVEARWKDIWNDIGEVASLVKSSTIEESEGESGDGLRESGQCTSDNKEHFLCEE